MSRIYFDNNSTTALDSSVLQVMVAEMGEGPSNPSSVHHFGKRAKGVLVRAREVVALFFGVKPEEVVFTSGATEGLNTLLRAYFGDRPRGHLVTTALEHAAVYETVRVLEGSGLSVSWVGVGEWGAPSVERIEEAICADTRAIVLSAVNTETGVKLDVDGVAEMALRRGIPLILDAVALVGRERCCFHEGVTAFVFSGHKFHGPKGVGGVVVRSGCKFIPLLTGGGQEFHRRAGTENVAAILGLARAIEILREDQGRITEHLCSLRDSFEEGLLREFPDVQVNGVGPRVVNTSNLFFPGVDGETLLMHLDMVGIAASHGSACSSGALEPSRVLMEMGYSLCRARSSLRFSFGRMNTISEIDVCISRMCELFSFFGISRRACGVIPVPPQRHSRGLN